MRSRVELDDCSARNDSMIIELKAHVGEDGKITLPTSVNLPPGDVDIVITYLTDEETQDEALWDAQFAATPISAFERLVQQGLEDCRTGQTDEFDPNNKDD
jgi:hypothetical protein